METNRTAFRQSFLGPVFGPRAFSPTIGALSLRRKALRTSDYIVLTGLKISCIIGIFEWERKQKQDVLIDLKVPCDAQRAARRDNIADAVDYKKIAKTTITFVEKSRYQLVETMAEELADTLLKTFNLTEIELSVSKPTAIRGSQNVGVHIHRAKAISSLSELTFLSLGSNISPKQNLAFALKAIAVKYTLQGLSHVYLTSPVGYSKQPAFWNMAAAIATNETPEKIRIWLSTLEKKTGRTKRGKTFGPRTLDVDLIVWKDLVEDSKDIQLPHPDIASKAFVLFPLLEIAPHWVDPGSGKPIIELAAEFKGKDQTIQRLPTDVFADFPPYAVRK